MTDELLPRDLDGDYRLLARLGQGGMGVVYRGIALALDRPVAVKMLRRDVSAPLAERFLNEARLSAQIESAHVVDVLHFGRSEADEPFLVMEYLRGLTLGQVLRREGRLSPERTVHVGVQLCRALAAAHDIGVVHRDLKPANIMLVQRDGVDDFVKVLDFGIAKLLQSDAPRLTDEGMVVGTLHSIAPEQVQGLPIDGRADMYATGALLYRCLTGQRVFDADDPATFADLHVSAAPVPPTQRCPDLHIPPALEVAVLRCLQKDPDHRYRDMRELADALLDVFAEAGNGMATRVIARHLGLAASTSESTPVPVAAAAPVATAAPAAIADDEERLDTLVMGTPDFAPSDLPGEPTEESPAHARPASEVPEAVSFPADPDPTDETPMPMPPPALVAAAPPPAARSGGAGWLVAGVALGVLVALGGTAYIVATHEPPDPAALAAEAAAAASFDFGLEPDKVALAVAGAPSAADDATAPRETPAPSTTKPTETPPARAAKRDVPRKRARAAKERPVKSAPNKTVTRSTTATRRTSAASAPSKATKTTKTKRVEPARRATPTKRAGKSVKPAPKPRSGAPSQSADAPDAVGKADKKPAPKKRSKKRSKKSKSEWTDVGAPPPPL